jgi:hypothetical protein
MIGQPYRPPNSQPRGPSLFDCYAPLAGMAALMATVIIGVPLSLSDNHEGSITVPAQTKVLAKWPNQSQVAFEVSTADESLVDCGANTNPFWGDDSRVKKEWAAKRGSIVVCNLTNNDTSTPAVVRLSYDAANPK